VRFGWLAAALAMGVLPTLVSVPPAVAAGEISSQRYVKQLRLDELKKEGLDGSGVTIAVIDGPVDLSAPELAGADVTVVKADKGCYSNKPENKDPEHGTGVLSLLANRTWGWAPKARFLYYQVPFDKIGDLPEHCADQTWDGYWLNEALNDGADIISISMIGDDTPTEYYALARAALKGVPAVYGAGNDGSSFIPEGASLNGQLVVGASDPNGQRSEYSNWGRFLNVLAPGGPMVLRDADAHGKLSIINKANQGTSYSVPMVSGALALAMQRWPDANGNQLIRSLLATAGEKPTFERGSGVLNAWGLVHEDPSGFDTTSPLMDKFQGDEPSAETVQSYVDGVANPQWFPNDKDYVYRGTDPDILANLPPGMRAESVSSTATPTPALSPSPVLSSSPAPVPVDGGLPVAGLVVAAVVVVAGVVVAIVLMARRRARVGNASVKDG